MRHCCNSKSRILGYLNLLMIFIVDDELPKLFTIVALRYFPAQSFWEEWNLPHSYFRNTQPFWDGRIKYFFMGVRCIGELFLTTLTMMSQNTGLKKTAGCWPEKIVTKWFNATKSWNGETGKTTSVCDGMLWLQLWSCWRTNCCRAFPVDL